MDLTECAKIASAFAQFDQSYLSSLQSFTMIHRLLVLIENSNCPVGIWCQNYVASTSMRRDNVALTLIRRYFYVMRPVGTN